ncbi:hypothetical protein BFJ63_vAg11206 [Fusarium oxysporum f. sp. narcissi]|uniref:Major facilitator superfamily (MFS) profile domain-containing protein n=1 Tax=Fusarium oxysporum f. sp. narcissi TaxID=451672 RepID=A0A4Q2VJ79_FUSOX|nr:hypothetical protein BFJ63_vAg11206 [Fusarium oxysporum f. sp. narcissi]
MLGNVFASGISPLFGLIMQEFHCTENEASQLGTYVLLTLGLSSGEAQSYQSLRSARILGGLAGGLIETLTPTILAETFPRNHLAKAMVVYVGFLAVGAALGPIISGAIAKCLGEWRWLNRVMSIAVTVNLVFNILMLPETTRDVISLNEGAVLGGQNEDKLPSKTECKAEENKIENVMSTAKTISSAEQVTLKREYVRRSFSLHFVELNWKAFLISFFQPLKLIVLPQVLVTVIVFGLTIGWTVIASILISLIYTQPPSYLLVIPLRVLRRMLERFGARFE